MGELYEAISAATVQLYIQTGRHALLAEVRHRGSVLAYGW